MTYTIEVSDDGGVLRVEVAGQRNIEDSRRLWGALPGRCREAGCTAVVAVLRLRGRLATSEMFAIGAGLEEFGWDREVPLALVETNAEVRADTEFGATVAFNRGWRVRVFADEDSAREWLAAGGH